MKRIVNILLIGIIALTITGCNEKKNQSKVEKPKYDIVGTWNINTNVSSKENNYSLRDLFGTCLNMSSNDLVFNEDKTFSFNVGCTYNMEGNYKLDNNIVKISNIKDSNITNKDTLKDIEKNMTFVIIEYNDNQFIQVHMDDFDDDVYIFFGKTKETYDNS